MSKQPHLCVDETQVAERVIVCGEPDRANRIAALLENAELIAENREYRLFNGEFQGKAITVCSTGIGAPSMIIAVEELKQCGAKYIIRVGSAGAMQPNIALGELIVAEGAVRDEGGSKAYIDAAYPAYASFSLLKGLDGYLQMQTVPYHMGVVRSHDSFYTDDEETLCQYWNKKGILGADMETSALFTVGRLRGLHVASVLNNVVRYQQDVKEGVSQYVNDDDAMMAGEKRASLAALTALSCQ
ncbi:nucleoside phosphorylase [Vibrio vulnificus]|jgi:uridine phosphorylase|uniref:Uridine phosphorylase n=2 Tax=Vibrio vulnificus TaxID=672 RepID=A0ABX4X3P5_VIBVL|nr:MULTISPECIES: nucleoside phosphorylase [Vibrio]EWS69667.1 uridine phosphorylase [Vibrio vulnificus BAA87]ASJ40316.1 uridine phosphorylase [Vibrio vulnificus]ASM98027.1 uridine phosphorylase [Vibrio vulnificus NBRC 15645 = ATCC 27562]AVX01929.1 uridine phosphorylase [Vibrio vulnificus Env1]EGQ7694216.1 nucleoside phosphorylase [Vibrio vulnificus]